MHLRFLFFPLLSVLSLCVNGQKEWQKKLVESCYHQNSDSLPYRIYIPPQSDSTQGSMALVLFLHGAGERGNDNKMQLLHGVKYFMADSITSQYHFVLLAPQCPENSRWVETDWTLSQHIMPTRTSKALSMTFNLMDSLIDALGIDSSRIYITGLSMGGFGTWDAIQRRPDFFAAAIPICGGGDENLACTISKVPVWAFHGKLDHLVIPARSINMITAMRLCGGFPELTLFNSLGHLCWDAAYSTPGLMQWLFLQKIVK